MHEVYYLMFQLILVVLVLIALLAYVHNVATDLGFEKRFTSIDMALLTTVVHYAPGTLKQVYIPIEGDDEMLIRRAVDAGFENNTILITERQEELPPVLYWFLSDRYMDPLDEVVSLKGTRREVDLMGLMSFEDFVPPNITYYKTGKGVSFDRDRLNPLQLVCPVLNTSVTDWQSEKVFIAKVLPGEGDYGNADLPVNRIGRILSARYNQVEVSGTSSAPAQVSGGSVISAVPDDASIVIAIGDSGEGREPGSLVVYIPSDANLLEQRKFACFLVNELLTPDSAVFYSQVMPVYVQSLDDASPLNVFEEKSDPSQVMVFLDISTFSDEQVDVDNAALAIYYAVQRYFGSEDTPAIRGPVLSFTESGVTGTGIRAFTPVRTASGAGAGAAVVPDSYGQVLSQAEKDALLARLAEQHGFEFPVLKAFLAVEAGGRGFGPDGRLKIRVEPHVFNRKCDCDSGTWGDTTRQDRAIAGVSCQGGQEHEHECLESAVSVDEDAAYKSISMGLPQIMGFHHQRLGYSSPRAMFEDFSRSEAVQIQKFIEFLSMNDRISSAIRSRDWETMARIYNGDTTGRYASRLQQNYDPSATPAVA